MKVEYLFGDCVHREYDSLGRLEKIKERDDCNPASAGNTIEYSYSAGSTPTDSLLVKVVYKDDSGTVKRTFEYTYHDSRQVASSINPVSTSNSRAFAYSADGLLSQVDAEGGLGKTVWTFDPLNRREEERRYKTSSTFDTWTSSYAAQFGFASEVEDDDAKSVETHWDDMGRRVKVVSPDSGTTLFVYDAAGRLTEKVEAFGTGGEVSHVFTYDNLGRILTADYGSEYCGTGEPVDITYAYDSTPVSCPGGASCALQDGRLAYVRSTLLCSSSYGDNTLDQEVFYGYDDAGRLIEEYLEDPRRIRS